MGGDFRVGSRVRPTQRTIYAIITRSGEGGWKTRRGLGHKVTQVGHALVLIEGLDVQLAVAEL